MRFRVTPLRILGALAGALVLTALILYRLPSGSYLLLPDVAHPVAPLVRVQGATPVRDGTLFFVDVREQQASELDVLFRWLHPHSTLLPASDIVPPGSTSQAVVQAELREMAMSQRIAGAVALRRLGYHVVIHPDGVLVNQLVYGTNAVGKLQPTDVIVSVDGKPTPTITKLRAILAKVKPGKVVTLRTHRGEQTIVQHIRTIDDHGRALVGFAPAQDAEIHLPIKVSIDAGNIGGPSAGLAFALEVMQQLGHDVTHGHKVVATGEMALDGTVLPIGGIEQKTWGAREAGADVFLVPAGQNAIDARRFAGPNLRIIAVHSFAQALRVLATLPPRA